MSKAITLDSVRALEELRLFEEDLESSREDDGVAKTVLDNVPVITVVNDAVATSDAECDAVVVAD